MTARPKQHELPHDAIMVRRYSDLLRYLRKFASGELGLVLLLGRHGTGKTESAKNTLGIGSSGNGSAGRRALYVEGHAQPFGMYQQLWEHRDQPIVLDDLDKLYANTDCVRLLKPLCNDGRAKEIAWITKTTINAIDLPSRFETRSNVLLIANYWRTLNPNVRALEDRAIILHFDPDNAEVHRKVKEWFDDPVVFEFIAGYLPVVPHVSMRHYDKGRRLRRAGFEDWRQIVLQMMLPDRLAAIVAGLQVNPRFETDKERVRRFIEDTGMSRPTYYRVKRRLPSLMTSIGPAHQDPVQVG
ncbi:MAG: hypothetical protein O7F08_03750 [Deltaproteobacteria bacterium]|nr:hypothetical protein [Deltaproteobacteria bacterium]